MLAHLYFRRIYINYEINNYANVFSIKNRQEQENTLALNWKRGENRICVSLVFPLTFNNLAAYGALWWAILKGCQLIYVRVTCKKDSTLKKDIRKSAD